MYFYNLRISFSEEENSTVGVTEEEVTEDNQSACKEMSVLRLQEPISARMLMAREWKVNRIWFHWIGKCLGSSSVRP